MRLPSGFGNHDPGKGVEAQRHTPAALPSASLTFVELRSLSDEELVAQLADGCQDALAILFERYKRTVFGIARRILRDDGEAEETVQQVFLDIYRAVGQFDSEKGTLKSWLLQFAYHRTINRQEQLRSRRFYNGTELDETLPELVDGGSRPLRLSPQETVRLIEQLLSELKARQRKVIELTFFQGLTAEEVAKHIGESPSVVRHDLYRGMGKLRNVLLQGEQGCKRARTKSVVSEEGVCVAYPRIL